MILINGHLSEPVYLMRGLHQGSPLSPILFLLVGQMFTARCVQNEIIKGLCIEGVEIKLSLFADDTDSFLEGETGIEELFRELGAFGRVSGCCCNKDKTVCVPLGKAKSKNHNNIKNLLGESAVVNRFTALGVSFDNESLRNVVNTNYESKLEKADEWVKKWSRRYLTIYGKITIVKTLLLSQYVYLILPLVTPPISTLNKIQAHMYKFIWSGKPDKIKRAVTNNTKLHGGVDMIEFKNFFISLKVKLVGMLTSEVYNHAWKQIVLSQLGNPNVQISIENQLVKPGRYFTQDLLAQYNQFLTNTENATDSLRDSCIWYNRHITDLGRPLFNQNLVDAGIMYVSDFVSEDLEGKSYVLSMQKFQAEKISGMHLVSMTEYRNIKMGIKRAFPVTKLQLIDKDVKLDFLLNKKGECKKSGEVRSKTYKRVKFEEITPLPKWNEKLSSDIPWFDAFECLYQTTSTNKLLEFQYKLMHRIATSRYMRKKMKIESTDLCHMCEVNVETLEHQQLYCTHTQKFRKVLETQIVTKIPGSSSREVDYITCISKNKAISYLRLVANYYINMKFHKQKQLWWEEYTSWVKKFLQFDKNISVEEKRSIREITL